MQMVVNQYFRSLGGEQRVFHAVNAAALVEVEAENQVGFVEQFRGELLVARIGHGLLGSGQEQQAFGHHVGRHDADGLSDGIQRVEQPERRADGVAVRGQMARDYHALAVGQKLADAANGLFVNDSRNHSANLRFFRSPRNFFVKISLSLQSYEGYDIK